MTDFIKNYKSGFDPYKLDVSAAYEFKTMWVAVKDGVVLEEHNNGIVNLASTSKPFTMSMLAKTKIDKFIATKDLVKELIFRKQDKHLQENPDYKEIVAWLSRNKIKNPKSVVRAKLVGNNAGLYNWKARDFPEVEIDFKELCFNALTLSSNSAIEIARNKLEEIYKDKVQEEFDKSAIAPTLQLHQGGFKLLNQTRANSGDLKEIVLAFDKLIKSGNSNILNAMKNNKVFFDVGSSFHLKNYDVYEKTGGAWPINYGEELEKLKFPPHMVMGTLFSANGVSFGIFKVLAIAIPKTLDSNGFPNIYEKNYSTYANLVKYKFLGEYRKQMFDLIKRNTKVKFNPLPINQKLHEEYKKNGLKLRMLIEFRMS